MSSIRSISSLVLRRVGARQNMRPMMNTRILLARRNYATAPPTENSSTSSNPLLWIGKQLTLVSDQHINKFKRVHFSWLCLHLL
jgi:hypothetical protein